MVPDSGAPRPAPRRGDRLPQRSGPAPCDRKNPRMGTAAGVRARMECRTPQGPSEGGAEHRPVGADSRRRHDPPALQPPPPHPPDRRCLRGRHARLPRSAGGSTRGSSARGLAHPRGPSPSRISAVGIGWRGRPMKVVVLGGSGVAGRHVVEALRRKGADAIPVSRRNGVDLATGSGLREALSGAQRVIDASSDASPDEATARAFFTASARHLQREAERAGVERLIVVSIVGVDRLSGGYGAAKLAQERAIQSGPVPAFVVRSTQFYELLWRFRDWGPKDGVWRVPEQLVQPVAVAAMARVLAQMTLAQAPPAGIAEVAGPQEEPLVDVATRWAARRGEPLEVQELPDDTADGRASRSGALLPGPHAAITGQIGRASCREREESAERGR